MADLVPVPQLAAPTPSLFAPLTDPAGGAPLERLRAFTAQPPFQRMLPWLLGVSVLGVVALTWAALSPSPQRVLYSALGDAERASVVDALDKASIGYTMGPNRQLKLIDSNIRRRAAISHALSASGFHVEPFENIEEFAVHWPQSGVVLLEDRHDAIATLLRRMAFSAQWLPVVGFSDQPSTHAVVKAILGGAVDYIEWPFDAATMKGAFAAAEASRATIGTVKLREVRARRRVEKLSRREREVLEGIAGGLSNRLIGEQLAISPRTVEIHRANLLTKMGANHTSDAIRIAVEAALVA